MFSWFHRRSERAKRLISALTLTLLLVSTSGTALLTPRVAQAQFSDLANLAVNIAGNLWDSVIQPALKFAWEHGAAIAFRNAARTFSTQVAYQSAVMLGSGGQGQTPLFTWKNLGKVAQDAADSAAGDFIETLGESNGYAKLGLCQPGGTLVAAGQFKQIVGLTLFNEVKPRQPKCTLSQLSQNWEKALADPKTFLQKFNVVLDPNQHDLGVMLKLQENNCVLGFIHTENHDKTADMGAPLPFWDIA